MDRIQAFLAGVPLRQHSKLFVQPGLIHTGCRIDRAQEIHQKILSCCYAKPGFLPIQLIQAGWRSYMVKSQDDLAEMRKGDHFLIPDLAG